MEQLVEFPLASGGSVLVQVTEGYSGHSVEVQANYS